MAVGGAMRDLERLPKDIRERIVGKLDFWVGSGMPLSFAETLTNYELGSYRFRVGHYRVAFDVEEEIVVVLVVKHRKDIYR